MLLWRASFNRACMFSTQSQIVTRAIAPSGTYLEARNNSPQPKALKALSLRLHGIDGLRGVGRVERGLNDVKQVAQAGDQCCAVTWQYRFPTLKLDNQVLNARRASYVLVSLPSSSGSPKSDKAKPPT